MTNLFTSEVTEIVVRTFIVSFTATCVALIFATAIGFLLIGTKSKIARTLIIFFNSFMSIPAVLIGLVCYLVFSGKGILGFFGLLYTPYLMIIAQAILAFPVIISMKVAAMKPIVDSVGETLLSLGANRFQQKISIFYEGRRQFIAAATIGFSRVIGETGMTMMVGGNIKGETRVMTTTIALETMKGNFEIAIILGVVLFAVAVIINIIVNYLLEKKNAYKM